MSASAAVMDGRANSATREDRATGARDNADGRGWLARVSRGHDGSERLTLELGALCFVSAQVAVWLSPANSLATTSYLELMGAWLVALPTFRDALFPSDETVDDVHSNRLVSLAILASLASGETWAAFVTPLIMRLGHWLESRGVVGVEDARESLRQLTAGAATVVDEETGRVTTVASVQLGQLMVIRPNESFVADGVVETGNSTVDESTLTGESFPRSVGPGATILAGTTNGGGMLRVRATAIGQSTLAGRVARDFDAALACKPGFTKTLERYARWYVPAVAALASATFLATGSIPRATALLLVCCPCALALAGPASWIATASVALRRGILIRAHGNWEALADVDSLALDKTGTITTGELRVSEYHSFVENSPPCDSDAATRTDSDPALSLAWGLALSSSHPAATAIVHYALARVKACDEATEVNELAGQGLAGQVRGARVLLGKPSWLESQGVALPQAIEHAGPVVGLAIEGRLRAYFLLADSVRSGAAATIEELRGLGVSRVVMLTGDHGQSARHAAAGLALDEIFADCTPQTKRDLVLDERSRRGRVAMAGDGVNDALALAASDVGIAVSRPGASVARGAADVILLDGNLSALPVAVRLARGLRRLVVVNVSLAVGCTVVMAMAASAGATSPVAAAVLHNIGAGLVLMNSGLFVSRELRKKASPVSNSGSSSAS